MTKPTRVISSTDYSQEKIEKKIDAVQTVTDNTSFQQGIVDTLYPVGSVMMRYDTKNPKTLPGFGATTWTQLSTGRYIMSSSSAGTTGGSTTTDGTAITTAQMPSHTHSFSATSSSNSVTHTHSIPALTIPLGSCNKTGTSSLASTRGWNMPAVYIDDSNAPNIKDGTYDDLRMYNSSGSYITFSDTDWVAVTPCSNVTTSTSTTGSNSANHTHSVSGTSGSNGSGSTHTHTYSPPYISVVVWRRTV